jgi:uncharacterized protein YlxW (UPF0749 family)
VILLIKTLEVAMKKFIILLVVALAVPAAAETWKDQELREARELKLREQQADPNYYANLAREQERLNKARARGNADDLWMQNQENQNRIQQIEKQMYMERVQQRRL